MRGEGREEKTKEGHGHTIVARVTDSLPTLRSRVPCGLRFVGNVALLQHAGMGRGFRGEIFPC